MVEIEVKMLNKISPCSFKSYIPVTYYAKDPNETEYTQIISKDNMRKCQSFVVRNLNGTAKNMRCPEFVNLYKSYDKDYQYYPVVHSVYDKDEPIVYMVTGKDVDIVQSYAKNVGKAKSESIARIGESRSYESRKAAKNYFKDVKKFLNNFCNRVRNNQSEELSLRVYFDTELTKTGNIKGFKFANARFIKESE